jgi:hypothetical protein
MKLELEFGSLVDSFRTQLERQGYKVEDLKSLDYYQEDADALDRLCVRGILNAHELARGRQRLLKRITSLVSVG